MWTKLYLNEKDKTNLDHLYNNSYKLDLNKDLRTFENATVIPPTPYKDNKNKVEYGIFDSNRQYVIDSGKFNVNFDNYSLPKEYHTDNREILYCGNLSTHYGHFLIESTTRLTYYLKNRDQFNYLCFSAFLNKLPNFAKEFFELLDIPLDKIILVTEPTKFQKIILPPCSYYHMQYFVEDFSYPFIEAAKKVQAAPYKKIFFTRKYWDSTAKCLGEEDIEKLFNKNGFHSVAMEKLSLKEQIAVIKGAKEIAGINGTAFHNILFSEEPKTLIMLNRNEETDCQYIINEATGAKCNLIQVYNNPLPVYHPRGPFIVGVTKYLKDFLKDYGLKDFGIQFYPNKYLEEFLNRYCLTYLDDNYQNELKSLNKNLIDSRDMISILNCLRYSKFKYYLFKILSKTTFGKSRKKFKKKYKELKNIKNASYEFKY